MPRAIWKGAITFGLVYVPVEVFPATQSERTGFNLLDRRTLDPVGYQQINKRTGKPIQRDDIVRGYEYEKGAYVVISDEEIEAASPESTQTVDLLAFVEAPQVSFLYLDTPYWLAPDKRAGKTYALLRDALAASGKIGIASVVLHSRQHLAALVPAGPALALQTLRWSTEVREFDAEQSLPKRAKAAGVSTHELQMARKLIDDMSTDWNPETYRDTYRDAILELAERKVREGKAHELTHVEAPAPARRSADVVDLSELLKRSLGKRRASDERAPPRKPVSKRARRAA
ncbi:Non-homologous end joining protein Ku [Paraburkholderia hiiakae]|uniref:Non-homologous end joining protein Ku n=1 Tax=Paraburkholderia hiiakae TaxID=1081782 RepID=A0ABM8P0S5_9BURK|nr:Ku protein [Paraburkholderia hiiakae]CAD6552656.1 Non-homologous end joining protein Ku [Paraburkholderia hiiakae]